MTDETFLEVPAKSETRENTAAKSLLLGRQGNFDCREESKKDHPQGKEKKERSREKTQDLVQSLLTEYYAYLQLRNKIIQKQPVSVKENEIYLKYEEYWVKEDDGLMYFSLEKFLLHHKYPTNLSGMDLSGFDFSAMSLRNIDLSGADMHQCIFSLNTNFKRATLENTDVTYPMSTGVAADKCKPSEDFTVVNGIFKRKEKTFTEEESPPVVLRVSESMVPS